MRNSTPTKILKAFKAHLLEEGKPPATVFKFCKEIKIKESAFYDHFASFESIQSGLWGDALEGVFVELASDETFQAYSLREKWLATLFSFFEALKAERSLYVLTWPKGHDLLFSKTSTQLREKYLEQASKWIDEGEQESTIKEGCIPMELKQEITWWHFVFLIDFWLKDDSKGFERTDVLIEKTVHLLFDVMGHEMGEKLVDLVKFLAPNHTNPMDLFSRLKTALG